MTVSKALRPSNFFQYTSSGLWASTFSQRPASRCAKTHILQTYVSSTVYRCLTQVAGEMKMRRAFWGIASCSLVEVDRRFRGSTHLWNVGLLQREYTALYPRWISSSYSLPWGPEISHVGLMIPLLDGALLLFMSMGRGYVSALLPRTGLLFFPIWYGEPRWNDSARGNRRTRRETWPSATLSTTKPTWNDLGANRGLRDERPVALAITGLRFVNPKWSKGIC
jgi:hypothetical protein